jgi:hypothetical protein
MDIHFHSLHEAFRKRKIHHSSIVNASVADLGNIPDEEIFKKGFNLSCIIDAYKNLNLDDHFKDYVILNS